MNKSNYKVGDQVKVSPKSEQIYRISWLAKDSTACQIEGQKSDGGWYSPQNFDTELLIKA